MDVNVVDNVEKPADVTPAPPPVEAPTAGDPFAVDENSLVSFSPEQRASLQPILDGWKKRAADEIQKRESSAAEKYQPYEEKAAALDKLTNYAPFVQWWQAQQRDAQSGASQPQKTAIEQTKPQDVATQQEWQEAIWEASQGDAKKLESIQARMMAAWATPVVQGLTQRQQQLETQIEVKDLFERHPDAKELDAIGIDPKTKQGVSILEMALDWAERNRQPLEAGYLMARQWADALHVKAKQESMGLLQEKKQTVTAGNSTASASQSVVEVANYDELLRRTMEAQLSGQKDVRFVVKGK